MEGLKQVFLSSFINTWTVVDDMKHRYVIVIPIANATFEQQASFTRFLLAITQAVLY